MIRLRRRRVTTLTVTTGVHLSSMCIWLVMFTYLLRHRASSHGEGGNQHARAELSGHAQVFFKVIPGLGKGRKKLLSLGALILGFRRLCGVAEKDTGAFCLCLKTHILALRFNSRPDASNDFVLFLLVFIILVYPEPRPRRFVANASAPVEQQ